MKLLLYSSMETDANARIKNIIEGQLAEREMESFNDISKFLTRLGNSFDTKTIVVVVVPTEDELFEFLLVREQFNDVFLILVLPDRKSTTIAKGHKLFPRFISYIERDYRDIKAVLEKIRCS